MASKKLLDKMKMPAKKAADKESDDYMSDLDMGSADETHDEGAEEESPEEEASETPADEKSEDAIHKQLADISDDDLKMEMEARGFTVMEKDESEKSPDEQSAGDEQSQMPPEVTGRGMDGSESQL
jgi:hypothetical protein